MMGAGVVSRDGKSNCWLEGSGMEAFSVSVPSGSERVDDIERRLVRAGVRVGNVGGALDADELEFVRRGGGTSRLSSASSSRTVAG